MHRPLKIAFKILQAVDLPYLKNTFCEIFRPHAQCNFDSYLTGVTAARIKTLKGLLTNFSISNKIKLSDVLMLLTIQVTHNY